MKRLRNFLKLSGSDRYLLAITFILLGAIRLGLFFLAFQNLLKLLQKINKQNIRFPFEIQKSQISVGKIVWAVNVATRYMPGEIKCLARALTAEVLMRSHDHSPELRIGVAKTEGGKLQAHAWIEYQGRVAIGGLSNLSQFVPLPSLMQKERMCDRVPCACPFGEAVPQAQDSAGALRHPPNNLDEVTMQSKQLEVNLQKSCL